MECLLLLSNKFLFHSITCNWQQFYQLLIYIILLRNSSVIHSSEWNHLPNFIPNLWLRQVVLRETRNFNSCRGDEKSFSIENHFGIPYQKHNLGVKIPGVLASRPIVRKKEMGEVSGATSNFNVPLESVSMILKQGRTSWSFSLPRLPLALCLTCWSEAFHSFL